jgi:hypothetical protein
MLQYILTYFYLNNIFLKPDLKADFHLLDQEEIQEY